MCFARLKSREYLEISDKCALKINNQRFLRYHVLFFTLPYKLLFAKYLYIDCCIHNIILH